MYVWYVYWLELLRNGSFWEVVYFFLAFSSFTELQKFINSLKAICTYVQLSLMLTIGFSILWLQRFELCWIQKTKLKLLSSVYDMILLFDKFIMVETFNWNFVWNILAAFWHTVRISVFRLIIFLFVLSVWCCKVKEAWTKL
jgi:hypothetical protein